MKRNIAKIAVAAAIYSIDRPYSYIVPEKLTGKVLVGCRVTVPFGRGNRRSEGIVLSLEDESERAELKCVERVLDPEPVFTGEQIKLALWMRERFFCTLYEAARAMLPAGMWFRDSERRVGDKIQKFVSLSVPGEDAAAISGQKRMKAPRQSSVLDLLSAIGEAPLSEVCAFTGANISTVNALERQGLVTVEPREVFRRPVIASGAAAGPIELTAEQGRAFEGLREMLMSRKAGAALLYGVTGSGKTSVYIRLCQEAIKDGRTALIMVPEIALTPQLVEIFTSHFGDDVAVLHSSLSTGERYDEWKRIKAGMVHLVIGTRSAVFAPLEKLGLIVIDEEQEHTYKSENPPRYHARDVAKYRCVRSGALLVLGSATPSVESMYEAQRGKYRLFTLPDRYNSHPLPEVIIADMREEIKNGNGGAVSSVLRDELAKNIENGEQSILFLNRRGASNLVMCGECGYTFECRNCSVSMTYHSVGQRLRCHYCGWSEPVPEECPECHGKLKFVGVGTQKLEEELHELFPGVGIIRMDTDTVARAGSHQKLLSKFKNEKVPILLGTQMVTKGLDFPNVTLAAVICADQSLYAGDFRAHERTFSLITQLVGRSGRGEKSGRAVLQTFTPENFVLKLASGQDYMGFYEQEIKTRALISAPPVRDSVTVTVTGLEEAAVLRACVRLADIFKRAFPPSERVTVLGPAPAGVTKVNNRYRYRLTLQLENKRAVRDIIYGVMREFSNEKENRKLAIFADADPMD